MHRTPRGQWSRPRGQRSRLLALYPWVTLLLLVVLQGLPASAPAQADEEDDWRERARAPERAEGLGPFGRLILRGVTLIDGTGAPPVGPIDIVIEGNRITSIKSVGFPGVEIRAEDRPEQKPGDQVYELAASYVLPGFIDMHGHIGGKDQGAPAEYVFKLWMGHGITTVRDPGSGNGLEWTVEHRQRSARNEITAPRIHVYTFLGSGQDEPLTTPEAVRAWVKRVAEQGADGIKLFAAPPDVLAAMFDEAKRQGLGTAMHHAQTNVARANVLDTARLGLTTMEHWYGLPEALFEDRTVQDYPLDYNYNNEQHRFGEAGRLWQQAADPGSPRWTAVMDELLELGLVIDPTLTIYEATRDLMRAWRAEWHEEYTLPSLWDFYRPNRRAHGAFWFYWTTQDEIDWRNNYRKWMQFLNEFKNRGGRVVTGSDSGFIYKLYGFDYIRELELLQEAGFHPLEVVRSATLEGARSLGVDGELGTVEVGKLADLVVVDENPVANFKVLYGTGALKLGEDNQPIRVGGVRYTIKDGIVYDSRALLADVRRMVAEAKAREQREIEQPGREKPQRGGEVTRATLWP